MIPYRACYYDDPTEYRYKTYGLLIPPHTAERSLNMVNIYRYFKILYPDLRPDEITLVHADRAYRKRPVEVRNPELFE
jgi:hypothetical protein